MMTIIRRSRRSPPGSSHCRRSWGRSLNSSLARHKWKDKQHTKKSHCWNSSIKTACRASREFYVLSMIWAQNINTSACRLYALFSKKCQKKDLSRENLPRDKNGDDVKLSSLFRDCALSKAVRCILCLWPRWCNTVNNNCYHTATICTAIRR